MICGLNNTVTDFVYMLIFCKNLPVDIHFYVKTNKTF